MTGAVHPDLDDTVLSVARLPITEAPITEAGDAATAPPSVPHYGFRVGENGRAVWLDVAAYIGRAPVVPRIQNGPLPRLVKVASPRREVSSTHLEIRQLATSIIVTDLRSTNGSVVSVPGGPPRSLRQGESLVVTPGTLVDIGDGNVVEILPLQRQLGGHGHDR